MKTKKIILFIIKLIFIGLIFYSSYKIYNWYKYNKKNENKLTELKNEVIDNKNINSIDFEKLKDENPNTVGWLRVEGTDIDYPVIKGTDNSYYLTHSFDKSYNIAGWIFANYNNKFDGTDKNITIFGHNMRNGSMFGTLKNVLKKDFDKSNKITLYTENDTYEYQIFSVYKVEDESYYFNSDFTDEEYNKFIDTILKRSIHNYNINVSNEDEILTLSTCDTVNNEYRVVVHAKKIKN